MQKQSGHKCHACVFTIWETEMSMNVHFICIFWLMQVPGVEKIRFVGQRTIGTAAVFGLFLSAGALIHCGKSY